MKIALVVFLFLISFGFSKNVFAATLVATNITPTSVAVGGGGFTPGVSYQITISDTLGIVNHTFVTACSTLSTSCTTLGTFGVSFTNLTQHHNYDLMATLQSNGTPVGSLISFTTATAPTTVTLTATPSTLASGQSTTLSWTATNVTGSCIAASNPNIIAVWDNPHKALSGTQLVSVVASNNFSLSCTDASGNFAGQANAFVTVTGAGSGATAAPIGTPPPGTFPSTTPVTLSSSTSGATIRYVIDASTPTCTLGSTTNPMSVSTTTTIKAIACDPHGVASTISSLTYTINSSSGGTPPPPTGGPTTNGSMVANDPTSTMVTLDATGLSNTGSYLFAVYNNTGTPSYYQTRIPATTDGTDGESPFPGLSPSGSYTAYLIDQNTSNNAVPSITFSTLATDPLIIGAGSGSGVASTTPASNLSNPAGGLVPACTNARGCQWADLMSLVNKVVKFILFDLGIPIAAIMFMYAGFLLVTSGGNPGDLTKAKGIFTSVLIGLVISAAAWLIINIILTTLGFVGDRLGF